MLDSLDLDDSLESFDFLWSLWSFVNVLARSFELSRERSFEFSRELPSLEFSLELFSLELSRELFDFDSLALRSFELSLELSLEEIFSFVSLYLSCKDLCELVGLLNEPETTSFALLVLVSNDLARPCSSTTFVFIFCSSSATFSPSSKPLKSLSSSRLFRLAVVGSEGSGVFKFLKRFFFRTINESLETKAEIVSAETSGISSSFLSSDFEELVVVISFNEGFSSLFFAGFEEILSVTVISLLLFSFKSFEVLSLDSIFSNSVDFFPISFLISNSISFSITLFIPSFSSFALFCFVSSSSFELFSAFIEFADSCSKGLSS